MKGDFYIDGDFIKDNAVSFQSNNKFKRYNQKVDKINFNNLEKDFILLAKKYDIDIDKIKRNINQEVNKLMK